MDEKKMRKIILQWEGPFSEETLEEEYMNFDDKGIYQIYGTHPTSGSDTLLYIGQTDKRTFRIRLKEEIKSNNNWYAKTGGAISFYLASACYVNDNKCSYAECEGILKDGCREFKETDINTVEKLLINAHMPPCNSQNLTIKINNKKIDNSN